ncbi:MAG: cysteine desulfurase [Pirellulaceae bacterium]|nr:cysteine desulfurase [Pirellulaceae bacterium]
MRRIYLDYNATTPIAPSVLEAMEPFLHSHYGNASSSHWLGRAAAEGVSDARGMLAGLLSCDEDEIVFTSGGTESNNLAIKGVMLREPPTSGAHLVISALEHPAVNAPAEFLRRMGYDVSVVPANKQGIVEPDLVFKAIKRKTRLVSIIHANNEIGTIQPIRQIADFCHSRSILVHTDAAQTVGKIRTDVDQLDVDLLTVAAHKFYGPKGVGALFVRGGVDLEPLHHGGDQESGLRAGTENTAAIVGLGRAAVLCNKALDESSKRMEFLRDDLLARLEKGIGVLLNVNGFLAPRLPNTLSVVFPSVNARSMLDRLPQLAASTGSACHSTTGTSGTLQAIGLSPAAAQGTMRLSLGWYTSQEDIETVSDWLIDAWQSLTS